MEEALKKLQIALGSAFMPSEEFWRELELDLSEALAFPVQVIRVESNERYREISIRTGLKSG